MHIRWRESFEGDGCRHDNHRAQTIIITHATRNEAAAPAHVCMGIRIHAIDIVQSPGIGIPCIPDMETQQTTVAATLAAKSSTEMPMNVCREARPECLHREPCCSPVA